MRSLSYIPKVGMAIVILYPCYHSNIFEIIFIIIDIVFITVKNASMTK